MPGAVDEPTHADTGTILDTAPERKLGFFARGAGEERLRFHPWKGERTLNGVLYQMRHKDGTAEIHFAPGRYEIEQWIHVNEVNNLTISGSSEVELVFSEGPDRTTLISAPVSAGNTSMLVEHPDRLKAGRRYQIYRADGRADRLLEFTVMDVMDGVVLLTEPARYMQHVKDVPVGSQVMEELNFFRVRASPGFTLQGINMDGRNRGGIRGHTIYCGVYATGRYKEHQRATTLGMSVRNCTFRNLSGRGMAFYGWADVVVEDNYFSGIRAQAIEIDHFASGVIKNNVIDGAEVGVMVNDAYESIIEGNMIRNCGHGVRFLELYKDDWVNTGNVVRDNWIGPGCRAGVMFFNEGMVDNPISGNRYFDLREAVQVINGQGNPID